MAPILAFRNVSKVFFKGDTRIHALRDVSAEVEAGELLAIVGPSGCGKSTLLNLSAGLMEPGLGEVHYKGKQLVGVNSHVSYVTQRDNLLPWRTVEDNVLLPFELKGRSRVPGNERRMKAREYIEIVGSEGL